MKFSIALSILILAAAAFFGWQQQGQLVTARETRLQVMAEARALGLAPDALLADGTAPLPSKLGRMAAPDKAAAATAFARELIAFAVEMKAAEKTNGAVPDEAMQTRGMETMARLLDFDADQIKQVIADLKASTEIDEGTRGEIIAFSVLMLASEHPEAALAIFTESSGIPQMHGMGDQVVSAALGKWAEKDPLAALEWIQEHSEKHAGLVTYTTKSAVIAGAAKQDPKLALRLLDELKLESDSQVARSLAMAAKSPEDSAVLLAALREGGDKHRDLLHSVLGSMAHQMASESFDEGQQWLATAQLSDTEMAKFAESTSPWPTNEDTGKWIDWMAVKLPADQRDNRISQMVNHWTRQDHKAAGEWINSSPEGPAKVVAVKSFARTVAPFEPETALQWANTLPAGKDREDLLRELQARSNAPDPDDE